MFIKGGTVRDKHILLQSAKSEKNTRHWTKHLRETRILKVKQSHYRPEQGHRVDKCIAVPFRDHGARRGCVVSVTPWPFYPRERPGTHCTGGWVGPQGRSGRVWKISPTPGFFFLLNSSPRYIRSLSDRLLHNVASQTLDSTRNTVLVSAHFHSFHCPVSLWVNWFDPRAVQPAASRYTDWAIPVPYRTF
jgi:hypothetical protein